MSGPILGKPFTQVIISEVETCNPTDVVLRMTRDQFEALLELLALVNEVSPEFTSPEYAVEARRLGKWFSMQGRLQGVN